MRKNKWLLPKTMIYFAFIAINLSCEKDLYDDAVYKPEKSTIKEVKFDELFKDSKFKSLLQSVSNNSNIARSAFENQNGFTISNTNVKVIQTDSVTSYTMLIQRDSVFNYSYFENLVIQEDIFNNQKAFIIKYTPNQITSTLDNSFAFQGKIKKSQIAFTGFNRSGSYQNTTQADCYIEVLMCSYGEDHVAGQGCVDKPNPTLYLKKIAVLCQDNGGGSGGSGDISIGDPFNGGGGSSGSDGDGLGDPFIFKDKIVKMVVDGINKNINATLTYSDSDISLIKYAPNAQPKATYAAMVERLDKHVGEVVAKLKELGLDKNTLIMFSSDNGVHKEGGLNPEDFNSNSIYRGNKRDLYEGGIKTPMLAKWPSKIKPGTTSSHVSAFWDVLPTLAEITGSSAPENIDGISFVNTLLGKNNQVQHNYMYWEFHAENGKQAVRKGKWKAVKLNVFKKDKTKVELYNLDEDPSETKDLAFQYPKIVKELVAIMDNEHIESTQFPFYIKIK